MDKREQLKSMVNSMINDEPERASLALHSYLAMKMREVANLVPTPEAPASTDE